MVDHDLRGKQGFCFEYVEFEQPIRNPFNVVAIQNVNLELIGESTTGISRWYLKWKLDKINEGVDEDRREGRRGEIAYKGYYRESLAEAERKLEV